MVLADYLVSLKDHSFQKLIIGAALKDYQSIEDYAYLFTHAQADVIDISAFPHSVISAKKGIAKALRDDVSLTEPLIMVSVNIGEDPHFRRIELDTKACTKCLACIPSCPSQAFSVIQDQVTMPSKKAHDDLTFVYDIDLCFGCANCLPYCHDDALSFSNWNAYEQSSLEELSELGATAIEIHLDQNLEDFKTFYQTMTTAFTLESFCIGSKTSNKQELEKAVDSILDLVFAKHGFGYSFIIQVDGIPMSGAREDKDIDKDQFSINKARLVLNYIKQKYPSFTEQIFVQLAGGSNENTLAKAIKQNVLVSGVAIGSYARKKLKQAVNLEEAIKLSKNLVANIKKKGMI